MVPFKKISFRTTAILTSALSVIVLLLLFVVGAPQPITPIEKEVVKQTFPSPFENLPLTAEAAIVVDLSTGNTLYSKNPDKQLPLASLTKLLTLYAASRVLSPTSRVTVTASALAEEGDSGLKEGETFAFEDLARLTLVASSNDGARAIANTAEALQSTDTLHLLASAVTSAGLSGTYALNGTGLDETTKTSGAYGTARDMTKLAGAFLKTAPTIAEATTRTSVRATTIEGVVHTLKNTNQDVIHMPNMLLSKTGYTDLAGGNLVVVFDVGIGHNIAIAVLGSTHEDRFTDVASLTKATLVYFAEELK